MPLASDAAWSEGARPRPTKPLLADSLDEVIAAASGVVQRPPELEAVEEAESFGAAKVFRTRKAEPRKPKAEPEPEPEPEAEVPSELEAAASETLREAGEQAETAPRSDRLAAMRDIARKLRANPSSEETLQFIIDVCCDCTGASAGMLTVNLSQETQQVVHGTALGAGPYISVPLRVGGPTFGEIVLTRLSGAPEFEGDDETFADLVAEYVAKAISSLRAGTVLSQDEQDFVDRIVQEFHSPLSSALNLLELVLGDEGGELPEPKVKYAETVLEDAQRMLGLVRDLDVLAHLRPPEVRDLQKIAVTPWLRDSVERMRPRAEAKGLTLTFEEPAETHVVQGIPAELDIVMDHLLGNAVKFTDSGGTIEVAASIGEGQVQVIVSDDGMGFDSADAPRMLDRYARAINADAARIPGTGLGLYLVSSILTNHQGRVWLESHRDDGTRAYVQIPLAV